MTKTYLFTGEEWYLLHKEVKRRQENFENKNGPDTVVHMSLPENNPTEIMQTLCSWWLFSDNKLIILSGMPWQTTSPKWTTELEENIINQRWNLHPDYFIIFVSPKPDKRKKAFKFFSEHCETKIFSPMDMRSLPKFISEEFEQSIENKRIKLERDHINTIVERVGTSGWILHHEILKLTAALNSWYPLNTETIHLILTPNQESTAFELSDALIERDGEKILHSIKTLSENWESRQWVQWWLLWSLKQIISYGIIVWQSWDPKSLWLAPFVAWKYNKHKDNIYTYILWYKQMYNSLIEFDYKVKNGEANDSWYRITIKEQLEKWWFLN